MPNNNIKVNQVEFLDKTIHAKVFGNQVMNPREKKNGEREVENDEHVRDFDRLKRVSVSVWPIAD